MTNRAEGAEGATRRRLLQTGAGAVPMMVTIKAASAQVNGGNAQGLLASVACLRHSEIPHDYRDAVDEVAETLGLTKDPSQDLAPQTSVQERPGGWLGSRMGRSLRQEKSVTTQAIGEQSSYDDWTYEDFEKYFGEGRMDFYPGANYNPSSQYHNTFLEITVSTACWSSIQTQMAQS